MGDRALWRLAASVGALAYLTLSDFGFTFIAKNEMTMKAASGDLQGALVTYQSVFMLLNVIVAAVTLLAMF